MCCVCAYAACVHIRAVYMVGGCVWLGVHENKISIYPHAIHITWRLLFRSFESIISISIVKQKDGHFSNQAFDGKYFNRETKDGWHGISSVPFFKSYKTIK